MHDGIVLFSQAEFIVGNSQLSEKFHQRRVLCTATRDKVGHGMKAGVNFDSVPVVVRVETASSAMLFSNADFLPEMCEPYPGGKPRHSGSDYDAVIFHLITLPKSDENIRIEKICF